MSWYRNKTNLTVVITAVINIISATTGYELPTYFNEAALGLILIFLRQGVAKSGPNGGSK